MPALKLSKSGELDPYRIMLSELMLQQTQVDRVLPKYLDFIRKYPNASSLAGASFVDILALWKGLGYNRRAQYLHGAAGQLSQNPNIRTVGDWVALPGIGKNTAAAICVYSFNQPIAFIETNIRSVVLHHFYPDKDLVADSEVLAIVEQAMSRENPREWYWALMDYGTWLKKNTGNASRRSKHYVKQSKFEGSRRQLRGRVLEQLLASSSPLELAALQSYLDDNRLGDVLTALEQEGSIQKDGEAYFIAS